MKIYLAGPMRGISLFNFPEFDRFEAEWKALGHHVISPAATSRSIGYCEDTIDRMVKHGDKTAINHYLRHVIAVDLLSLFHCEAIVLLPGWAVSVGATVELAYAQFLGLKVYCAVSKEEIYPPTKPWVQSYSHFQR
jgi:hypothetical protein